MTCEVCGAVVSREILPKGHQYEAVVTAPTCTEGGYTTYTCSVCGDSYVDDHTDALGHDFQVTVVEAQEGAEGYTQHTCLRCGYSYRDGFTEALACPSAHFTDVDTGRWYHEGVDFAVSNGLMKGVSDTQFRPEGILTAWPVSRRAKGRRPSPTSPAAGITPRPWPGPMRPESERA